MVKNMLGKELGLSGPPLPVSPLPQSCKARWLLFPSRKGSGLRGQQLWLERKQDCHCQLVWEWHASIPTILHIGTQFQPIPFSLPSVWQTGPPVSSHAMRRKQGLLHRWEGHAEEEAIKSVCPKVTPNNRIFCKILLQTLFRPVKIIARHITGE